MAARSRRSGPRSSMARWPARSTSAIRRRPGRTRLGDHPGGPGRGRTRGRRERGRLPRRGLRRHRGGAALQPGRSRVRRLRSHGRLRPLRRGGGGREDPQSFRDRDVERARTRILPLRGHLPGDGRRGPRGAGDPGMGRGDGRELRQVGGTGHHGPDGLPRRPLWLSAPVRQRQGDRPPRSSRDWGPTTTQRAWCSRSSRVAGSRRRARSWRSTWSPGRASGPTTWPASR